MEKYPGISPLLNLFIQIKALLGPFAASSK
jgi:hypothetical protein